MVVNLPKSTYFSYLLDKNLNELCSYAFLLKVILLGFVTKIDYFTFNVYLLTVSKLNVVKQILTVQCYYSTQNLNPVGVDHCSTYKTNSNLAHSYGGRGFSLYATSKSKKDLLSDSVLSFI